MVNEQATPDLTSMIVRLAEALGETEPEPVQQIARIVERLGPAYAHELLQETQRIEREGGLMVRDRSRRRTPGGVFFQVTRQRLEEEGRQDELAVLFEAQMRRRAATQQAFVPPPAPAPVQSIRPRKRLRRETAPPARRASLVDREAVLQRMIRPRPDQATILATLERHLGSPPDLYRRSVDPRKGTVTLCFYFPTIANERYSAAIAAAAGDAGVDITIAPQPHQGALRDAVRAELPPGLTATRIAIHHEQQLVRVRVHGEATPDECQGAAANFCTKTGWQLDIAEAGAEAPDAAAVQDNGQSNGLEAAPTAGQAASQAVGQAASQAADPPAMNMHQAASLVRSTLGDACYKVSADQAARRLAVRFLFPDVAREQYAAVLVDLANQTGWEISVYPEAHQGALAAAVRRFLPPDVELISTPSFHRDARQVTVRYRGALTEDARAAAEEALVAETGWRLVVRPFEPA